MNESRFCPYQKKCGACQLQNLPYPDQLSWKMARTIRLLGRFGHVSEILGMEEPYHYRNKAQAAFGKTARGKMISGIYQSGTHRIVAVDSCFLENETADRIIVTIRRLAESFGYQPYDEDARRGFLRHVLVRTGDSTGQVLVAVVTGTPMFPRKNDFVKALLAAHPEITTLVQNINDSQTSMVLGERQTVLFGKGYIEDELCGCRFRISPQSFYQINHAQTEKLYDTAIRFAELKPGMSVLDAYCGIGTIGLVAAKSGCRVIGAEINPQAIRDAAVNRKLNGAQNAEFLCADAGDFMRGVAEAGERIDVVFTDPPRAGCSREFLASLCPRPRGVRLLQPRDAGARPAVSDAARLPRQKDPARRYVPAYAALRSCRVIIATTSQRYEFLTEFAIYPCGMRYACCAICACGTRNGIHIISCAGRASVYRIRA